MLAMVDRGYREMGGWEGEREGRGRSQRAKSLYRWDQNELKERVRRTSRAEGLDSLMSRIRIVVQRERETQCLFISSDRSLEPQSTHTPLECDTSSV